MRNKAFEKKYGFTKAETLLDFESIMYTSMLEVDGVTLNDVNCALEGLANAYDHSWFTHYDYGCDMKHFGDQW